MLAQKTEQIGFGVVLDNFEYDSEVNYLEKNIKKALMKGKLKYNITKDILKKWFCKNLFNCDFLENISNEDLYFVAEEKCNIKLN